MAPEGIPLDAVLNLLDRQVLDVDGLMVCKVDDLELREEADGTLLVTAVLAGPAALLPRFSGRLGNRLLEHWRRLGLQQWGREVPWRVDLDLVERIDNAVHLSVGREQVLHQARDAVDGPVRRRLDHLLHLRVVHGEEQLGTVLDVRLEGRSGNGPIRCRSVLVGKGRPGSMLGYDRHPGMGPAILGRAVRWLHRHTGEVALDEVTTVDWERGVLRARAAPVRVSPSR